MAAASVEQQSSAAGSPEQAAAPEPHGEQQEEAAAGRGGGREPEEEDDDDDEEDEEDSESSGVSERSDSPAGSSLDGERGSSRPEDGPSPGSSAPSSTGSSTAGSSSGGDDGYSSAGQSGPSSLEGEPLSRMDSEDSISSTLMDVDSTISSGRSTPSMMNGGMSTTSSKTLNYNCCWDQCQTCFSSSPDLAEHIRAFHVDAQRGGVFVCFWKGCKVYNTPSTSQSWLQRHMLTHSGDKPFKCVVGGCTASFASQGGLARHVPTHFSQQNSSKLSGHSKSKDESPSKAGLNKRRKLKNKRKRTLPRPHDFFDAQTLDAIRHRAICFNLSAQIDSLGNGHSVVFHSTVIAKRKEDSGKIKLLLHWTPEDILPDVWVNENDRHQLKTKVVHLSKLPKDTALLLDPNIYRDSSKRIASVGGGSLADPFS
ncbi:zinc finger protein AEBP2 isoform X2 [Dendropsophus ebraccatus]|uniref:zinc finger protein AEBP2 isoform X2 n=1 Tax=Dendropsophus ebraccatus TaxID=150705 RepID=UPI00383151CC